ncbi:hypothetical protein U879_20190 [Defluviimonas sp. 20V17]|uniref:Regulator RcnB of Ni and Co efflux n=1 Tax=Allgaiera indica TaxID=765699 RepID=A0AAN4ZZP0_9RHOB|nr:hypothetical protein [Allgaiera indica]KDB01870.1 hypothetical protein U879_20190 [Defluviimonas sp. 20V17]GHE02375.1 hypothetical protein GCM10008024_21580 [Allgaiera indica]SDX30792.1 regulator RcnB of Ni and Co efflux [Allgaiera indica]
MQHKPILSALSISAAVAVLTVSLGNPALADGGDDGNFHIHVDHRDDWHDNRREHWREQRREHWREQRREHRREHRRDGEEDHGRRWRDRGEGERDGAWYRGEHLREGEFRVLSNWRTYNLPRPPYGQYYVVVDHDRVLRVDSNMMTVMDEVGLINGLLNN